MSLIGIFVLLLFFAVLYCAGVGLVWAILFVSLRMVAGKRSVWIGTELPASILVMALVTAGYLCYYFRPTVVFERQFGIDAPADTVVHNSSTWGLGDSGYTYLHFRTSRDTLNKLLKIGYVRSDASASEPYSGPPPAWYRPSSGAERYALKPSESRPRRYGSEHCRLLFDPTTGDAWYESVGVD